MVVCVRVEMEMVMFLYKYMKCLFLVFGSLERINESRSGEYERVETS